MAKVNEHEEAYRKATAMLARLKPLGPWAFGLDGRTFQAITALGGPATFYREYVASLQRLASMAKEAGAHG